MKPKILGIAGPAQIGKDTAADLIIKKYGFVKASFADPIKEMLMKGLGLTFEQMYGKLKDVVDERYKCTPRHLMQTLGTEWGRKIIDQNLWVRALEDKIANSSDFYVIPDVRFESEADFVRKYGVLLHITGKSKINSKHVSESGIYIHDSDAQIHNINSLSDYLADVERIARLILK